MDHYEGILICLVTQFILIPGSTIPPYPASTTPDSGEEEDPPDDSEDDQTGVYGIRYLWPIVFSIFAALVFGTVYTCTKKKRCAPRGSSSNRQSPDDATNRTRSGNDESNFATNAAFDGRELGLITDFPGSSFGQGIEMVPPPYCEKPPDYDDVFQDVSATAGNQDDLPAYMPTEDYQLQEISLASTHPGALTSSQITSSAETVNTPNTMVDTNRTITPVETAYTEYVLTSPRAIIASRGPNNIESDNGPTHDHGGDCVLEGNTQANTDPATPETQSADL